MKQLKERNKKLHRQLKSTKSDKMDKVLDLLAINLEQVKNNNDNNDQAQISVEEPSIDDNLKLAINGLGDANADNASDLEILPPEIKKPMEEKKQSSDYASAPNSMLNTRSVSSSPGVFSNFDYRRKIHGFIAEVTINPILEDEEKQQLVSSFYVPALSDEVSSYLDSLLATRKTTVEIARNLLWFINCLKKREDKI